MNREKFVVQYIRNKKKKPLGVLVAIKHEDGFKVGYSMCNTKDRFKKATALKIAFARADVWNLIPCDLPREIARNLPGFVERCKKYYRTSKSPRTENFFQSTCGSTCGSVRV
jgi:hypothetical protein